MNEQKETPRVSRLSIGRLCNLGNYEHIRYDVTVEIPEGADVTKTLIHVETALNMLAARCPAEPWNLSNSRKMLATPDSQLTEYDRQHLEGHRETVARFEKWQTAHDKARAMLNDFSLNEEYTNHKQKWGEDE